MFPDPRVVNLRGIAGQGRLRELPGLADVLKGRLSFGAMGDAPRDLAGRLIGLRLLHEVHPAQRFPEQGIVALPGRLEAGRQDRLLRRQHVQGHLANERRRRASAVLRRFFGLQ